MLEALDNDLHNPDFRWLKSLKRNWETAVLSLFFVVSTLLRVLMSEASCYPDSPNTEYIWYCSNWGLHYRGVSMLAL